MPKQILCALDLSPFSCRVLGWAQLFAKEFDASVTLLHAGHHDLPCRIQESLSPDYVELVRCEDEHLKHCLDILGDRILGRRLEWERVVIDAHPVKAIMGWIEKHPPALTVMGSHGRESLSNLLLGSVAENVMRHSSCPTLIARGHETDPVQSERVMCLMGLADPGGDYLELCAQIGTAFASFMCVVETAESETRQGENCQLLRRRIPEDIRHRVEFFQILKRGDTAEQIVRLTGEHRIDLVILQADYRPFSEFTTLDPTAEWVMRHTRCSVLLVPQNPKRRCPPLGSRSEQWSSPAGC